MNLADMEHPGDTTDTPAAPGYTPLSAEQVDMIRTLRDTMADVHAAHSKIDGADRRERFVASILDAINPIDAEYASNATGDEIDRDARTVARYVASLANALADYAETGILPEVPADRDEIDDTEV